MNYRDTALTFALAVLCAACGSSNSSDNDVGDAGGDANTSQRGQLEALCTQELTFNAALQESSCADEFNFDTELTQEKCVGQYQACSKDGVAFAEGILDCYTELPPCTAETLAAWAGSQMACDEEFGAKYMDMECNATYRERACERLAMLASDPSPLWAGCNADPADFPPLRKEIPSESAACTAQLQTSDLACRKATVTALACIDSLKKLGCQQANFESRWKPSALQCWSLLAELEKLPGCLDPQK